MKYEFTQGLEKYIAAKVCTLFAERGSAAEKDAPSEVVLTAADVVNLLHDFKRAAVGILENTAFSFYVMTDKGKKPSYQHPNYQSAKQEAERILRDDSKQEIAEILLKYDDVNKTLPF
jgi:hypothetical protein